MSAQASNRRLPWHAKLLFGLGEFGPSVGVGTVIPFYFLFFLTDVAGIRPGLAGSLLLVARLWDAFNDPLVGALSDRTRSRLGRRRPFMLAGALPMAFFFALLWVVPPIPSAGGRALYYLAVYFLFDLAYTLVSGPYFALTPELSLDSDERTSIVVYRMGVSILTGLFAAAALPLVFNAAPSMQAGFMWVGIAVGALSAVPYLVIVARIRERPEFQKPQERGLLESVGIVLRNRPFWLSLLINWAAWLAIGVVEAVFAYYLIYWAGVPEQDTAIVLAIILASAALFLPAVNALARRFEKKWAFVLCTVTLALLLAGLWWVPSGSMVPVYVVACLAGLGVAAAHVLPTAMAVDVLEAIELESGERQEGVFGGVSGLIQKVGTSLALLSIGWVLDLTGYVPHAAHQNPGALAGIRALTSWVPFALLLLAAWWASRFPITRAAHRRMTEEAAARRRAPG